MKYFIGYIILSFLFVVPQSLKALMPGSCHSRKATQRWKRRNLHTDDKSNTSYVDLKKRLQIKHKQAKKVSWFSP